MLELYLFWGLVNTSQELLTSLTIRLEDSKQPKALRNALTF
jgi:hypothetical protein